VSDFLEEGDVSCDEMSWSRRVDSWSLYSGDLIRDWIVEAGELVSSRLPNEYVIVNCKLLYTGVSSCIRIFLHLRLSILVLTLEILAICVICVRWNLSLYLWIQTCVLTFR